MGRVVVEHQEDAYNLYLSFATVSMNIKNLLLGVLAGLLVVALGVSAFIIFSQYSSNRAEQAFSKEFDNANMLRTKDDPASILHLQKLVSNAPDAKSEGAAKINLAIAYLLTDREKAVDLFKEISLDERYSSYTRAGSIIYALGTYTSTQDEEFAKKYLFANNERWHSFVQGTDMDEAVKKAAQWANSLYPTARASYLIALSYGKKLAADPLNPSLSPKEKENHLETFLGSLEQGDKLMALIIQQGTLRYDIREQASLEQFRGILKDIEHMLTNSKEAKEDAEQAFTRTIGLLNDSQIVSLENTKVALSFANYYYAVFLARLTAQKIEDRSNEVKTLVANIVQDNKTNQVLFAFLKNINRDTSKNLYVNYRLSFLANVDPAFASLLKRLGVVVRPS